jgi:transcription elongation factor Elf1
MAWKDHEKQLECQRRHYQNNKQYYYERNKRRREELKTWFKGLKSTLKCNRCGEDRIATLTFHHTDPSTKELTVANLVGRGYSQKRVEEEIAKCEILCANCHAVEHWIDD